MGFFGKLHPISTLGVKTFLVHWSDVFLRLVGKPSVG
jgi:hypothetical protein